MDQNTKSQNKNSGGEGFFQKNQNYIIAGIIVVLLIIYFATQQPASPTTDEQNNDQTEQTADNTDTSGDNATDQNNTADNNSSQNQNNNPTPAPTPTTPTPNPTTPPAAKPTPAPTPAAATESGNLEIAGSLMVSDNTAKGNYMVNSNRGKIYVSTKRDFAPWVGKDVTLQANGDINQFAFVGFKEATAATTPSPAPSSGQNQPDVGGTPSGEVSSSNLQFSGQLTASDDTAKGNYTVNSSQGKVYVKTARDLGSLVGKEVTGSANGTINSFTGLVISEKK